MTSQELLHWYNHERPQLSRTNSKGAQHGSTIQGVSGVLRSSILFEAIDKVRVENMWVSSQSELEKQRVFDGEESGWRTAPIGRHSGEVMLWGARPLDVVVEKAIASKRQLKKFPHFLQKAITKKLQEEEE